MANKNRWVVARNESEAKDKAAAILGVEADKVRCGAVCDEIPEGWGGGGSFWCWPVASYRIM